MEPKSSPLSNLNNRWVIGAAIGAALILAGIGIAQFASFKRPEPQQETTAPLPEIESVTALGRLEPENEIINLSAPASLQGTRVERLLVEEGDRVFDGDIVAILDSRDVRQAQVGEAEREIQVNQAELDRVQAGAQRGEIAAQRATVDRLQAELEGERTTQTATIERLRAELAGEIDSQTARIARLEAQLDGELRTQQATIDRLQAELNNARTECRRYEQLYRDGAVSESERDSVCLRQATAIESVDEAVANRDRTASTLREEIAEARATLRQTESTLREQINEAVANRDRTVNTLDAQINEALANLDRIEEVRPVDVQVARASVDRAVATAERAQAELELSYIRAPVDGRILEIHSRGGEVAGEEGIAEIGTVDRMYAIAEVYETDIDRVRLGQEALITSDAFDEQLRGTVEQIGLKIGRQDVLDTDPAADADVRVVEVKVRLNSEGSQRVEGLTNLQVEVEILVGE